MRTTSPTFRKLSRFRKAEELDLREAAELVAFLRLLGKPKLGMYLFGWKPKQIWQARRLAAHDPVARVADVYEYENFPHWDDETGHAILAGLIAGGWDRGNPPPICRDYLRGRVKGGTSAPKLAKEFGIHPSRMARWITTPKKRAENGRATAIASLVIG